VDESERVIREGVDNGVWIVDEGIWWAIRGRLCTPFVHATRYVGTDE
jgi:hypothetical protein